MKHNTTQLIANIKTGLANGHRRVIEFIETAKASLPAHERANLNRYASPFLKASGDGFDAPSLSFGSVGIPVRVTTAVELEIRRGNLVGAKALWETALADARQALAEAEGKLALARHVWKMYDCEASAAFDALPSADANTKIVSFASFAELAASLDGNTLASATAKPRKARKTVEKPA